MTNLLVCQFVYLFTYPFVCLFVCLLLPRRLPWLPSSFPKPWNGNVCDGVELGQLRRSLRTRQLRPFLLKLGVFHFGSENEKAKLKPFYFFKITWQVSINDLRSFNLRITWQVSVLWATLESFRKLKIEVRGTNEPDEELWCVHHWRLKQFLNINNFQFFQILYINYMFFVSASIQLSFKLQTNYSYPNLFWERD